MAGAFGAYYWAFEKANALITFNKVKKGRGGWKETCFNTLAYKASIHNFSSHISCFIRSNWKQQTLLWIKF